jgi:hypothetical protein
MWLMIAPIWVMAATAACVLTLEDWHCLPAELGEENRASLLGLARKFAPKG